MQEVFTIFIQNMGAVKRLFKDLIQKRPENRLP